VYAYIKALMHKSLANVILPNDSISKQDVLLNPNRVPHIRVVDMSMLKHAHLSQKQISNKQVLTYSVT